MTFVFPPFLQFINDNFVVQHDDSLSPSRLYVVIKKKWADRFPLFDESSEIYYSNKADLVHDEIAGEPHSCIITEGFIIISTLEGKLVRYLSISNDVTGVSLNSTQDICEIYSRANGSLFLATPEAALLASTVALRATPPYEVKIKFASTPAVNDKVSPTASEGSNSSPHNKSNEEVVKKKVTVNERRNSFHQLPPLDKETSSNEGPPPLRQPPPRPPVEILEPRPISVEIPPIESLGAQFIYAEHVAVLADIVREHHTQLSLLVFDELEVSAMEAQESRRREGFFIQLARERESLLDESERAMRELQLEVEDRLHTLKSLDAKLGETERQVLLEREHSELLEARMRGAEAKIAELEAELYRERLRVLGGLEAGAAPSESPTLPIDARATPGPPQDEHVMDALQLKLASVMNELFDVQNRCTEQDKCVKDLQRYIKSLEISKRAEIPESDEIPLIEIPAHISDGGRAILEELMGVASALSKAGTLLDTSSTLLGMKWALRHH